VDEFIDSVTTRSFGELSLESMRQDVANILDVDLDEVDVDENLIFLGLDSIRIMTLHSRWKKIGIDIELAEMVGKNTIKDWWDSVQVAA
jgi:bifunctional isochorismate lyase/aryl carrier protein